MSCKEWEARVALHVGGDLPAEMASAVEQHLAGCSGCQVLWSGMRENLELLQAAHAEPLPAAAYSAVRARVMADVSRRRQPWWHWAAGLAAAALVVMVALAMRPLPEIQPLPRLALAVPRAPDVHAAAPAPPRSKPRPPVAAAANRQPVLVRLVTNDPDIVLYWIAD